MANNNGSFSDTVKQVASDLTSEMDWHAATDAAGDALDTISSKLPSNLLLWIAGGAVATSLGLKLMGKDDAAEFIVHWAPIALGLGLYAKLANLEGHDYIMNHRP